MFHLPGNRLCHPDDALFANGRQIACNKCQIVLYNDVNDYLLSLPPYSSNLGAHMYAQETGDINDLQCKVAVDALSGIFPCEVVVKYDVLLQVVRLLGIMNCDFVRYAGSNMFDKEAALNCKIVDGFLSQLESLVTAEEEEQAGGGGNELISRSEGIKLLKALIEQMKRISQEQQCNVIDLFLNVYVPYVSNFRPVETEVRLLENANLPGNVFRRVCEDAELIRRTYSPYSLQFDLVYVLVFVYLCRTNFELIINLLLRLISQVCAGFFDEPHRLLDECALLLENRLFRNAHDSGDVIRTTRQLQNGNCIDVLSVDAIRHVSSLQERFSPLFRELWLRHGGCDSLQVIGYAESQMFPYVLFGKRGSTFHATHYYGLKTVLPFLAKFLDRKSGALQKHKLARARHMMRFVDGYMTKMRNFQIDGEPVTYWTLDMFKLFAGSDENFVQEIKNVFEELATDIKR